MTLIHGRKLAPLAGIAIAGAVACSGSGYNTKANQPAAAPEMTSVQAQKPSIEERCAKVKSSCKSFQTCLIEEAVGDCKGEGSETRTKGLEACVDARLPVSNKDNERQQMAMLGSRSEGKEIASLRRMNYTPYHIYEIDSLVITKIGTDSVEIAIRETMVDMLDMKTWQNGTDRNFKFYIMGDELSNYDDSTKEKILNNISQREALHAEYPVIIDDFKKSYNGLVQLSFHLRNANRWVPAFCYQ